MFLNIIFMANLDAIRGITSLYQMSAELLITAFNLEANHHVKGADWCIKSSIRNL